MTWTPGALVSLETENFTLRSIEREDANDRLADWMADPDVMIGFNLPRRRLSRAELVSFALNHDNRSRFCLMLRPKGKKDPIGLFTATVDLGNSVAESAVVIGEKTYWGQDVVRETRTALIDFLFNDLGLHKIFGRTHSRNFSSIYNYKVLGFKCEGILRQQIYNSQSDERLDQLIFGMLRDEWMDRGAAKVS